jgi:phosphate transport system substrate-binding protein
MPSRFCFLPAVFGVLLILASGCGRSTPGKGDTGKSVIRVTGSDTMVNVATAWAAKYHEKHPDISVQVSGGGSGVGIAHLIDGTCDVANTSRKMTESELKAAQAKRGVEPKETIVGYDCLAIYTNKQNPLESISIDQLAEIYGEGGKITNWSQFDVDKEKGFAGKITRVSRQNSSGTYEYFREAVLGKERDYKLGSVDQSGSKDVVALVSRTPSAVGYSGMGYRTPEVKLLKVAKRTGEPGVEPTVASAKDGSYPITRPLQIYTVGEPAGLVKEYLDWILSPEGQKIVLDQGYVPVSKHD